MTTKYTRYCDCGNALLGYDACNGTNVCSDCYRRNVMNAQMKLLIKEKENYADNTRNR